ncbi:MAG: penicillin-binding protein 2 [Candidatus Paceibacterota bacterium]
MIRTGATGRIRVLFVLLLLMGLGLVGKLYFVQVVDGASYSEQADHQYFRPNYNLYNRGDIYFEQRDGSRVPAATLRSGYMVAINPQRVYDPEATYELLSGVLELDKDTFMRRASRPDRTYEVIAKKLDAETAEQVKELSAEGVSVYRQQWRHYPGESMAAHTLGIVGRHEDEPDGKEAGRYGLERYYEDVLQRGNNQVYVNFFAEVFSNIKDTLFTGSTAQGEVVTGLEPNVQAFLESQLKEVSELWDARVTGGIIMDPATGQLLAMGAVPTFDPNDLSGVSSPSILDNPLVQNVYEMGSIIKPITVAIGLDTGVIAPHSTYEDTGSLTLDGFTIHNHDGRARGVVDMQEVLNQSLNTGAAYVARKTGNARFSEYMRSFAIGDKTGIDLPNETAGLVSNLDSPRGIEMATASFGQGIAMSPIATTRALAVLANGGKLVTPHVAREIVYENGASTSLVPEVGEQVIDSATSKAITRMLVKVVDEVLAEGEYSRERHSIAAKTGTAQIPLGGGYSEDRFLHSFFGYAPAYDPKFIVFLYTVEPQGQGSQYASQTLTKPFMDTVAYLINYYEVPPDR